MSEMQLCTRGGMYVGSEPVAGKGDTACESAAQGMLRAAASECPSLSVRALDSGHSSLSAVGTAGQDVGLAQVQRLLPSASATIPAASAVARTGPYVLSGGLGSLGVLVAEWLAMSGECTLWLLGRSGRVSGGDEAMRKLWRGTGDVSARRCDISRV